MSDTNDLEQQLREACFSGDIELFKELIELGASVHVEEACTDAVFSSALGGAIEGGCLDAVRMLLRNGLVLDGRVAELALVLACSSSTVEMVRLMLEYAPVTSLDEKGNTTLMAATKWGELEVMQLLLERGADVHAVEAEHGFTALHFAAREGFEEGYSLLVKHGANEEAQSYRN
jgi:ankyrin repeat protein